LSWILKANDCLPANQIRLQDLYRVRYIQPLEGKYMGEVTSERV